MQKKLKKIEVIPYNPEWPTQFIREANNIKELLGKHCIRIEHIGSTAIPGLSAKPEIDILCIVDNLRNSLILKENSFVFKGELNIPLRYYFSKNTEISKVNLHVVEPDHGFIHLNLCFRDYLRTHEEDRRAYANLKEDLLKDPKSYEKIEGGFSGYNFGKDEFIKKILKKAGYNEFTVNFCMHHNEWAAYNKIKEKWLPEIVSDHTFDHAFHFVLYKGIEIVCIAEVTVLNDVAEPNILLLESTQSDVHPEFQEQVKGKLRDFIRKWASYKS